MATYVGTDHRADHQHEDASRTGTNRAAETAPTTGTVSSRRQIPPRVVIAHVEPQVDCGHRAAKATVGELLDIEADVFADGHDALRCEVRFRNDAATRWSTAAMTSIGNDRWRATVPISSPGHHRFVVRAKVDRFATWGRDLAARSGAGRGLTELVIGAELIEEAARRTRGSDRRVLSQIAEELLSAPDDLRTPVPEDIDAWLGSEQDTSKSGASLRDVIFSEKLVQLVGAFSDAAGISTSETFNVLVDPAKARFSTWYEMFPRSASPRPGRHGTFADVRRRLDYVEQMGFDVLYLPPIHPIGVTGRKGREGAKLAGPDDPGSPWAIGSAEGGHKAIHPALGTLEDFRSLVADAAARGIDIAIDLAFQASPDHPWVAEHPEWFRHRYDGSIAHAENPPKSYEDIYPLDFETSEWRALWAELLEVVRYWISQGIGVFRVDNPHTKPFAFWEWLLATIKSEAPEVIFLSEAFTRPRVMEQLAKIGFTQSYTYFAWRSTKTELETYFTELTRSELASFLRPNLWPNTPDILTEELQNGGRAAFVSRLVLAATLGSSYGIYGPAFELQEHVALVPGSEEYAHSEKYEIRAWGGEDAQSLAGFIGLVNQIRQEHPALQFNDSLRFHAADNDQLIVFSKSRIVPRANGSSRLTPATREPGSSRPAIARPANEGSWHDIVVVVVNLDHSYIQSGWVDLDLDYLNVDPQHPYVMRDLLTNARYVWEGSRNFVRLDPAEVPCHILCLEQTVDSQARPGTDGS